MAAFNFVAIDLNQDPSFYDGVPIIPPVGSRLCIGGMTHKKVVEVVYLPTREILRKYNAVPKKTIYIHAIVFLHKLD